MMKYFYMLVVALMATASVNAQNVVLWGNNKDSQFDGGLNNWTAKGISAVTADSAKNALWVWSKDGKASGGAYYSATNAALWVNSPSFANGTAVFNSDLLETGGTPGTAGKCPGPHKGELTSPKFSIPTTEKELSVTFFQCYRNFDTNCYVSYSMDDGATWSANINLNSNITRNTVTNVRNQRRNVVLKGAVGSPDFRIRFTFDGRLYFWIIDDVEVIRSTKFNVVSDDDWFGGNHYRCAPKGLQEPFPVMNDVRNAGVRDATNVKLNAKVVNEATTKEVYNETINLGTIKPGDTLQNTILPKLVTLADVGNYTGTYTVSADSLDTELGDNSITFRTTITDTLYSHEVIRNTSVGLNASAWEVGKPRTWLIASSYYMPKGASKYTASMVQFGLNTTATTMPLLKGQTINVYVIKWVDADNNGNAEESEREIVGFVDGGYTIKGTEVNSAPTNTDLNTNLNVKLPIRDFADPSKKLKFEDETTYLVSVEYVGVDDKVSMAIEGTTAIRYRGSDYAITQSGKPRVAYQLAVGEAKDWRGNDFTGNIQPCIRLSVNPPKGVGSKEITLLPESAVQIAPNPAQNEFSVLFNFESIADNVTLKLVDVTGKIVRTETLENVKSEGYLFNISELAAGTYSLVINSEIGNTVKKVVIIK